MHAPHGAGAVAVLANALLSQPLLLPVHADATSFLYSLDPSATVWGPQLCVAA
jgi:hypothetical protein